jgi:hypothetical protein
VLLRWTITAGDASLIDYCVVVVTINGQQVVIGTVANDGDSEKFAFIDKVYGFQPGTVVYAVKFVYRDFSVSERSNAVSFYNHSYTPPGLMDGDYLGVASKLLRSPNYAKAPFSE